jgi:hypothetical protein
LEITTETLETVKKSMQVLTRFGKRPTQTDRSGMSDMDKIHVQLYLDVKQFSDDIHGFGVDLSPLDAYRHLLEAVATGQRVKGSSTAHIDVLQVKEENDAMPKLGGKVSSTHPS